MFQKMVTGDCRAPSMFLRIAAGTIHSPAKMWVNGLNQLRRPLAHLHTQFNRDLPWSSIDMDFMNLNQAAHGDREAGYIHTRLRLGRKVVAGHWSDPQVQEAGGDVDAGGARVE